MPVDEFPDGLTQEEFEKLIKDNHMMLVDLYTTWCGPCKRMKPIFEQLSEEFTNIKFISIEMDQLPWIEGTEYNTTAIPTFLLLKNGKLVHKRVGGLFRDSFEKLIKEKLLNN